MVHAQRPDARYLNSALRAGIPVMVWPRSTCPGPVHGHCAGEQLLGQLVPYIQDALPDALPKVIRHLRAQAQYQLNGGQHCDDKLTLFWDDPARSPDPPLGLGQ